MDHTKISVILSKVQTPILCNILMINVSCQHDIEREQVLSLYPSIFSERNTIMYNCQRKKILKSTNGQSLKKLRKHLGVEEDFNCQELSLKCLIIQNPHCCPYNTTREKPRLRKWFPRVWVIRKICFVFVYRDIMNFKGNFSEIFDDQYSWKFNRNKLGLVGSKIR